jgi:hypothetical protein
MAMLQTKICPLDGCGLEFQTDNPRKLYCSRQHATLDRMRRWNAKHRKPRGGGGGGGNGGGGQTLFDTITPHGSGPVAVTLPDTCYRTL